MNNLPAHAKLKANKDTFFLPDSNGGVYFRNNASSFRMDGDGIYNWIEKLMPMFNGDHSLAEITDGLPLPYQHRVFEIGEILYENGFVRDVSQDAPHELNSALLDRYASQIEFLEADSHSGALKFQTYRAKKCPYTWFWGYAYFLSFFFTRIRITYISLPCHRLYGNKLRPNS